YCGRRRHRPRPRCKADDPRRQNGRCRCPRLAGRHGMSEAPITTYPEALAWLYRFSDTERTGNFVRDREDNLARERALLTALGDPQRSYGSTHVAGTKGKGSTSALIAAILQAAGLRIGLYTQPDLHTFRERIRVNGELISPDEVVA